MVIVDLLYVELILRLFCFFFYLNVLSLAVADQVCPLPRVLMLLNPFLPWIMLPHGLLVVLATAFLEGLVKDFSLIFCMHDW